MATVIINGLDVDVYKLPMLKRLNLDRKVAQMVLPILGSFETLNISAIASAIMAENPEEGAAEAAENALAEGLDVSNIVRAVEKALSALSDTEFTKLTSELLSVVNVRHPLHGNCLLDTPERIDLVLAEFSPLDVYRLCIEVMRKNKFSPFVLSGAGIGTRGTPTSAPASPAPRKSGVKLRAGKPSGT